MLRERVITALILGPILIWVVLWAPSKVTVAIISLAILRGAWEWAQFCGWSKWLAKTAYMILIAVATLIVAVAINGSFGIASDQLHGIAWILLIATVWWIIALGWILLWPLRVNAVSAAIAGFFVLTPTWVALVYLHDTEAYGRQLLLFLLVLVVAADVAAYFAGRAFGRVKLAPRVSPGKTWEGAIGGIVGAAIIAVIGSYWFHLPPSAFICLCCAVVIASIVGDLTESMFKRHVGLKDSSNLLPGHGGILDRIDSITAAAPLFALGMTWLGALTQP